MKDRKETTKTGIRKSKSATEPDPVLGNPVAPGFKLPAAPGDTSEFTSPGNGAAFEAPVTKDGNSVGEPPKVSWFIKTFFILVVGGSLLSAILGSILYWHFSRSLPQIIQVADYKPLTVTRVLGGGGKEDEVLAEFFKERRYLIPYEKMPERLIQAFISAEDDKFFEHQGVNLASILRAAIANFRAGHVVQGGSTITQQVAKSLLLTSERSFVRKIKELILAGRMESNLTKQEILYLYLNQIYLGHGAYGVQAASKAYFNKDAAQLTLAEAALLAGMPQAPSIYSPLNNAKKSKDRQRYVLRRMYENKFITQADMANAEGESIPIYEGDDEEWAKTTPYIVEHLRRYLVEKFGEKAVYEGGLTLATPATTHLAKIARRSLQEGLRAVDKRMGWRGAAAKLKSNDEIEKRLQQNRIKLIHDKLGYVMFLADGRIDAVDALRAAGISSDWKLLTVGDLYEGVVSSIDEKRESANVLVGVTKAEIPFEHLRWANPMAKSPSQILSKGDVIKVKILKAEDAAVIAALEQEPTVQGALFSIDAHTGAVLAMEGGYDFKKSEFNRAIQAQRQPGSAYKPILYSAAIEKGFTPASIIQDSPIVYDDAENGKWKPTNFEEKFYGDTTLRQALIKSRNIPTIKLAQAVQVPYLIDFSKRLGMNANFQADLSISLGSATVSLENLVRTFAVFPRLGKRVNISYIQWVKDREGKILEEWKPGQRPPGTPDETIPATPANGPSAAAAAGSTEGGAAPSTPPGQAVGNQPGAFPVYAPVGSDPDLAMDPRVAFVMTHLMNEVVAFGTGQEAKQLGRASAGKTGTTTDYVDAWFMGFTAHVVTGVWVGNDASQKTIGPGETGARASLPIWLSFMKEAVKGYPDTEFAIPPGVVFASIDPTTGKLTSPNSSRAIKEAFIEGTQPTETTAPGWDSGTQSQSEFLKEDFE